MISKSLLPKFFKDVLQHIPTIALRSIDWKEVLKEMGPLVFKMGQRQLGQNEIHSLNTLSNELYQLVDKLNPNQIHELNVEQKKTLGQKLLKIYFIQLKNPDGLILDLRSNHFCLTDEELQWKPNNSWYTLEESFRKSIINIYKGFYFNDDTLFKKGLIDIGLTKNLDQKKVDELKILFFSHFGPGDQDEVSFELSTFSESFYKLFHFFVTNKVELHKNFIFIGIYLVTLYMHLEKLEVKLDVKSSFLEIFKDN